MVKIDFFFMLYWVAQALDRSFMRFRKEAKTMILNIAEVMLHVSLLQSHKSSKKLTGATNYWINKASS